MGRRRATGEGQSLVEFALVLPVFLLLLFGLIDGGRYVFLNNIVSQASREAARVAATEARWIGVTTAVDPSCVASEAGITAATPGAHVCPVDLAAFKAHVLAAANRMVAPFGAILATKIYYDCSTVGSAPTGNWTTSGCPVANRIAAKNAVSVRLDMSFQPITPLVQGWTPTLSGAATMVMN